MTPKQAAFEAMMEALEPFAFEAQNYEPDEGDDNDTAWDSDFKVGQLRRAAAALTLARQARDE